MRQLDMATIARARSPIVPDGDVKNGIVRVKGWVKTGLGWVVFHLGIHRRLSRGRAVIVSLPSRRRPVSRNADQQHAFEFEAFLRFFKRFYIVISLEELLERLRERR